jgi:hypothetical protein
LIRSDALLHRAISLAIMDHEQVGALDDMLRCGDAASSLDLLISHYRNTGNIALFFEARLMKRRLELGLPLIQTKALSSADSEDYQQAMIDIARETGELALERGDLVGAWRYFRAIGEPARVTAEIERLSDDEGSDALIDIAFQQGAHPAKGLAFIVAQHGMCRAITAFGMYPVQNGREECIGLLARRIHAEVLERIGRTVESQEGAKPSSNNIAEIVSGRDWLFGEYDTYVDTSHLLSLLGYATEIDDPEILELFRQLCEYGSRLSSMFQSRGQPPFDSPFVDYNHFIQARLGIDTEANLQHFRNKLAESDPEETGTAPAELLVNLLVELQKYEEAVAVSQRSLSDPAYELTCPSTLRLCQLAGDFRRMKQIARENNDYLSYVAASVLEREHAHLVT